MGGRNGSFEPRTMSFVIDAVENLLSAIGKDVTRVRGECRRPLLNETAAHGGQNLACWFLTPRLMAIETVVVVPLFISIGVFFLRHWFRTRRVLACKPVPWALKIYVTAHYGLSWWYKLQRPLGWIYMFMPCLLLTLVMVLTAWAPNSSVRSFLFQLFLSFWGLVVGTFLLPDTSGLDQYGEEAFFWVQHVVLLLWPIWAIATGRLTPSDGGWSVGCGVGSLSIALYMGPLSMLGLAFNRNLNYTTHPLKPLVFLGDSCRIAAVFGVCVLFVLARAGGLVIAGGLAPGTGRSKGAAEKQRTCKAD